MVSVQTFAASYRGSFFTDSEGFSHCPRRQIFAPFVSFLPVEKDSFVRSHARIEPFLEPFVLFIEPDQTSRSPTSQHNPAKNLARTAINPANPPRRESSIEKKKRRVKKGGEKGERPSQVCARQKPGEPVNPAIESLERTRIR